MVSMRAAVGCPFLLTSLLVHHTARASQHQPLMQCWQKAMLLQLNQQLQVGAYVTSYCGMMILHVHIVYHVQH
jgi:hypothetical protein